jgi:hypothetical protein
LGEEALGDVLVHADGGAEQAGADVGDVGQLQQPLHRAVFAVGAVQHGEHHVVRADERREVGSTRRADRDLQLGAVAVQRQGARVALDASSKVPARRSTRQRAVLVDADERRLELARGPAPAHTLRADRMRHLVLRRAAAEQDDDAGLLQHQSLQAGQASPAGAT